MKVFFLFHLFLLLLPIPHIHSLRDEDTISSVRKLAASAAPHVLNVHVVPHTHDDVGWRKTVEQYYFGYNQTMERCGAVHAILSTTIQALTEQPSRTFTYVEMKFFSMWWTNQTAALQDTVRYLLANRQLTIVNGGWCMHDEATTHYMGMIDQTTLGHQFLLRELGVRPQTGWQLDPFGHSATQASLLTYTAGMDALYFGRIDYQDLRVRRNESRCEGLWSPSGSGATSSSNDSNTVFWGLTGSYGGNYNPPPGFCFDLLCDDEPLVGANTTRLMERVMDFLQEIKVQSDQTRDNNIMLTFGEDFTFREAHVDFSNIDLLIGTVMNYQQWNMIDIPSIFGPRYDRVNIFYSNPDYYTQQKHLNTDKQDPVEWPVKTDDFFPYSDCSHCFWTGYFTSRAALKRFERVASSFLLAARQIDALTPMDPSASRADPRYVRDAPLYPLEDAVSIAQHHDAVSGTAKQHVADDYSLKLAHGIDVAAAHAIRLLKRRMFPPDEAGQSQLENLTYCPLLNETKCDVSVDATSSNDSTLYIFVYNPIAQNCSAIVRIPVASDGVFRVERVEEGSAIMVLPSVAKEYQHPSSGASVRYELVFDTDVLPPLGAVAFRIVKEPSRTNFGPPNPNFDLPRVQQRLLRVGSKDIVALTNDVISASFDSSTGMLVDMTGDGMVLTLNQTWGYYTSFDSAFDSEKASQNSGAYIFRPSEPDQKFVPLTPKNAKFVETAVGIEIHVLFEEAWVKQVTKIVAGAPYIENEYTVGPIPIDDGRGKEIVTRFSTPIVSEGLCYTDSNGRDFQKRKRNYRPTWNLEVFEPIAGNYYPVNAAIYLEDANAALAVLVDRSQGGASLSDGSLELMVQRRTLADDSRGVDEPMNETCGGMTPYPPYGFNQRIGDGVVISGRHRIRVGKGPVGASLARSEMDGFFAEPLVFVGSGPASEPVVFQNAMFSGLVESLPANIMLVTLMRLPEISDSTFLVRFGHQYGLQEHEVLSQPVEFDVANIFDGYLVSSIVEMSLTGNQEWSDLQARRIQWDQEIKLHSLSASTNGTIVSISPMEIRTFKITMAHYKM